MSAAVLPGVSDGITWVTPDLLLDAEDRPEAARAFRERRPSDFIRR